MATPATPLALPPDASGTFLQIPAAATAPALIVVGSLMIRAVIEIAWDDPTEAVPAFLTIIGMPLTSSIAEGLAVGFVAYPAVKIVAGRARQVSPLVYLLATLFRAPLRLPGGGVIGPVAGPRRPDYIGASTHNPNVGVAPTGRRVRSGRRASI